MAQSRANNPPALARTLLVALICALSLYACAVRTVRLARDPVAVSCESFLARMDEAVASSGVADAGSARIFGFPHLRINRFLASFVPDRPVANQYAAWLERLRKLDADARRVELRNLPAGEALKLAAGVPAGTTAESAITECGRRLAQKDFQSTARRAELLEHARVPDSYYRWRRIVGLYPLARWPIIEGVARLHRQAREVFAKPLSALPVAGRLIRYAPPVMRLSSEAEITAILKAASKNALGVPEPEGEPLDRLFEAFAPIWEIDTATDDDHIGLMRLERGGKVRVDDSNPVVYRLASHTRFGNESLLQLVYLIWLPARPSETPCDIYAGKFDGLIWRVTLSPTGRPLAYDSIHPCGCYYQVFPAEGFRVVQPEDGSEPVLSPGPLAHPKPGDRLLIRLAHGTHFIQRVYATPGPAKGTGYGWRNYDELRSLEGPDGHRRSLFDEEGLVPGSERPERFLFWPMGVPSAGAMRQWSNHAIAFLGRRHFDDPRWLERILLPVEPESNHE